MDPLWGPPGESTWPLGRYSRAVPKPTATRTRNECPRNSKKRMEIVLGCHGISMLLLPLSMLAFSFEATRRLTATSSSSTMMWKWLPEFHGLSILVLPGPYNCGWHKESKPICYPASTLPWFLAASSIFLTYRKLPDLDTRQQSAAW